MKFSIVTPNFNGARFLEATIASVAAQRAADVTVEHWIVDGGSSDGSLEIIRRYLGPDTFLISERDHGSTRRRRSLLGAAAS